MKGRWIRGNMGGFDLRTDDGQLHAHVFRSMHVSDRPWCVFVTHLEGNDSFATAREAKLHARKRLRELLAATEALR